MTTTLLPAALATTLLAGAACAAASEPPSSSAPHPCCPVLELRQYTLHPGAREALVSLFEREFVESQEALGIRLVGLFRDLDREDRFVWLRGFEGMPQRTRALEAFYGGPVWQRHREAANANMIDSDDVLLLRPALADSGFAVAAGATPPAAGAHRAGVVEIRVLYAGGDARAADLETARREFAALLQDAGGRALAMLAVEHAPNRFPRLPVREGEHATVLVSAFPDAGRHTAFLERLAASPAWHRAQAALTRDAPRAADILRLAPTARSRLP